MSCRYLIETRTGVLDRICPVRVTMVPVVCATADFRCRWQGGSRNLTRMRVVFSPEGKTIGLPGGARSEPSRAPVLLLNCCAYKNRSWYSAAGGRRYFRRSFCHQSPELVFRPPEEQFWLSKLEKRN